MTTFMLGIEDIAGAIETLMYAMDDMTLLERAQQAQDIEALIVQVRQAEIQYLQQLAALQEGINASVQSQIEQLYVGGLTPGEQRGYYQSRIAEIMAELQGGSVTSPEQLQQLMSELQGYISALAQGLGDQLYEPVAPWGGQTWAEYLSGILEQAQGYSDAYFEQFRDEIRAANDDLIDALRDLIDALTNFGGEGGGGGDQDTVGGGHLNPENLWYSPQVNVFVEGSMAALRPLIRAEIRNSATGGPTGIM
jgi:hypothetical protein